jgi:cytochrome c5
VRPWLRLAIVLVSTVLVAAACAASLRHPSARDVEVVAPAHPGTTLADLERGRAVYVRRCSSCHALVLPTAHPPAKWPGLVDGMAAKARLAPGEREDVVRFLVAVASDRR